MSEIQVPETLDGPEQRIVERRRIPTFLLTIAILTFVGSFLSLVRHTLTLFFMGIFGNISKGIGHGDKEIDNFLNWTIWGSYSGILTALLCSLGAILMLKRKVAGYWIYMASQIVYIATTALVAIGMSRNHLSPSELIWSGFLILVAVGFCIMYTLNKSHLGQLKQLKTLDF